MIFLENDFLKTYNELDLLWESDENTDSAESSKPESEPQSQITFEEIFTEKISKSLAKSDAEKKDDILQDISFWEEVKRIIDSKYKRKTDSASRWDRRLLNSFYKPYLVENALLKLIEGLKVTVFEGTENEFTLTLDKAEAADKYRHSIYSDYLKCAVDTEDTKPEHIPVSPDFKANCSVVLGQDDTKENLGEITIDVKSISTKSSIHGAALVLRYKAAYADLSGTCWLQVPKQSKLLDSLPALGLNEINIALAAVQYSFTIDISEAASNDIGHFITAAAYLKLVDEVLKSKSTIYKNIVTILNNESDELADIADTIMDENSDNAKKLYVAPPRNLKTKVRTSDKAAQRLRSVADYLADVVVLNARNKNK